MKLASHNSWSYLTPKKWWMKLLKFTAKCQNVDIITQYEKYNVRLFDLRLSFDKNELQVNHGKIVYNIDEIQLVESLSYLNNKGDCAVRILLDVRNKKDYTKDNRDLFFGYCYKFVKFFRNIKFCGGQNLYNWEVEYKFKYNPNYISYYSSVRKPKLIDDWYPKCYAKLNNKKIYNKYREELLLQKEEDKFLIIDFVDIR